MHLERDTRQFTEQRMSQPQILQNQEFPLKDNFWDDIGPDAFILK